jgi:hypothetical protein
MDNWEEKIEAMAKATMEEDVSNIAGVPSWTLVLLKRILEIKGTDNIKDVWPNLELFMHGGVSFKPYKAQFEKIIRGGDMHYIDTYNASEGFFGIQDRLGSDDLLLMLDYGIFYEFMPMSEYGSKNPRTVGLNEVEIGENYALIISTNGGLWRYLVGDTVKFTSKYPFRVQVSGRTKQYINAFGEELMVENADQALTAAAANAKVDLKEYTAGPIYMDSDSRGGHEWIIECSQIPENQDEFIDVLDKKLREVNSDYDAKRQNDIALVKPMVHFVANGTFYTWMEKRGKLGGQHKVPRLSNSREYLEEILEIIT